MSDGESAARIERDIERTRAGIGATLDALQERLSISALVDEALHSPTVGRAVRSAGAGGSQFATTLGRSVRENPIPVVLTGVGLLWLALGARDREPTRVYVDSPSGLDRPTYGVAAGRADPSRVSGADQVDTDSAAGGPSILAEAGERLRSVAGEVRGTAERVRQKASHLKHSMKEGAERMQDELHQTSNAASGRAGKVAEAVKSRGNVAYERSRHAAHWTSDQISGGASTAARFIREYPIAAGAIALGVGAALALLFAPTRREREMLGEASEQAINRVRETVHDTVEKAKSAAGSAAEAAVETVRRKTGAVNPDETPRASFAEPPVPEDRVQDIRESPLAYDPEAVSGATEGVTPERETPRNPV